MAWWIFQNLVITTVLAAAVALACRAGRIGPVARHALWVLVLVKFVTPPLVVWPWAVPDPLGIAALDARAVDASASATVNDDPPFPASVDRPDAEAIKVDAALPGIQSDLSERGTGTAPMPWLLGLWACGSLCLLFIEAARVLRLVRGATNAAVDPDVVSRLASLSAMLGIRPIPVVMVTGITSPVVFAWGRPRLLWPAGLPTDATDACIDGILVHELAHVKRGDHLVGWLELSAGIVWWWNPLFWWVRSALREQSELACDAWVISALPNGRRAYAESLIALSSARPFSHSSFAVVGIRPTSRRVLERRLVMIMKGRTSLRLPWVGLACLALVAAATLPAWASAPQQAPPLPAREQVPVVVTRKAPSTSRQIVKTPLPKIEVRRDDVVVHYQAVPKSQPPIVSLPRTMPMRTYTVTLKAHLPEDGQQLLNGLEADLKAIHEEANQKTEARRAAAVKSLEALQEQYTKAGKLDEAVAIRDYLRAGGPGSGTPVFRYGKVVK